MLRGHEFIPGHRFKGSMRAPLQRRYAMWVERSVREAGSVVVPLCKGLEEFKESCPAVFEYMTRLTFPDGGERQVATLIFFIEEGRWKACLSDRECDRTLFKAGETLEDCLLSLDADIQSGGAGWRLSGYKRGVKAKKSS